MPRIVKHPDIRREELLDCAQALFLARGYENASLNEVIAASGLSKGAFYHYFASKAALLEALAGRMAQRSLALGRSVLEDPGLDALARLNAFLAKGRQNKLAMIATAWALFESLYREDNLILFHRINAAVGALFAPILTELIRQGVKEGQFTTFDPAGVAEMVLQLGASSHGLVARTITACSDQERDAAIATMEQRIRLYEVTLDRLLGLPDGSVHLTEPGYVRAVMLARGESGLSPADAASGRASPAGTREPAGA